ncbi:type II secretion system protein GspF [Algimonas ampicilliniresistens]|uniref:Type II secretion system protein GspF n=1 Tax=Algimonas ampicilliniresistens TaxID=1298735 RepID=A0ABQ5VBJ2_9PROT|nr:type II secretion system inner membrane protein GspF [Algimonas ampicilliniresistens]GLQ24173.1 type II secretion system protein GspF [Algimonas ampicilliniresistens]
MDAFDYAALDASGTRRKGTLMAGSARAARDQLRARRLTPVEVKPSRKRARSDETAEAGRSRIKRAHITRAARQLAILISAATPVEEALRITALQFERSRLRGVLLDARGQVMEGARLSEALSRHPNVFDPLFTAMVAAGETAGQLGPVLERRADDMEAADAIRRKILGATIYPLLLMAVALIVTIILLTLVVPKVAEQFVVLGETLPPLTRGTIAASDFLKANWWALLIGIGGAYLLFSLWKRRPSGRKIWDAFKLRLPVIGRIIRNLEAARFSRTIAGLISAGTPALAAMETARHTLRNRVMFEAVGDAVLRVREGTAVSAALKQTQVFPPLVVQMVLGGEASGKTGQMFAKSADYLEGEFEAATQIFLALLEPLIIILLGGIVLLIAAAIFLPILQLNTLSF